MGIFSLTRRKGVQGNERQRTSLSQSQGQGQGQDQDHTRTRGLSSTEVSTDHGPDMVGNWGGHGIANANAGASVVCATTPRVYVFLRCEDAGARESDGESISDGYGYGDGNDSVKWSIAVSQPETGAASVNGAGRQRQGQMQCKKSFFEFRDRLKSVSQGQGQVQHEVGRERQASLTSTSTPTPVPTLTWHEFTLESGSLHITQHAPSLTSSSHSVFDSADSMLLQILLPSASTATSARHPILSQASLPLNLRVEQALYKVSSAIAQFRNDESDRWLRFALIALQHEMLLPPPKPGVGADELNVERIMDFARNQWTGFEGEVLRAQSKEGVLESDGSEKTIGVSEGGMAKYVQRIDYARYIVESERVRGMVGRE